MKPEAKPVLPLWIAILLAAASGPVLDAGFPDRYWWPMTFVGIAMVLVSLIGRRAGAGFVVGLVAGASFYFIHIHWATLFLGLVPWSALSTLEALFFAVGAVAIVLAYRWIPKAWPTPAGRIVLLPVAVAGLWTAREAIASVWPYGGFAWGRMSLSQSDSPFSDLFPWLGVSGVSFVMVWLVAVIIEAVRTPGIANYRRAVGVVGVIAAVAFVPAWPAITVGAIRVAAVQGNAKAGYFDVRERGDNLQDQLDATVPLFDENVDVVVWPEGGSDIDPTDHARAANVFDYVSSEMDAPLVAGAIDERNGEVYNTSFLWKAGEGAVDHYDKKHPIPFGEYVPDREFWRQFAPDLIDLIGRDYPPGQTDSVFDLGGVIAGINICFDISDDQVMTESVRQGAQVIFAQTNNADFGHTDESVQQLAIARIRAMELGRSVVNISTVGTSAIIAPDGSVISQLETFTPAAMVQDVPLSSASTPALLFGREIEWFVSGLGLASLVVSGLAVRGRRD